MIKKVLFAGLGGVGSAHAIQLQQHDRQLVRVLAGGERVLRYRDQGFIVNGQRYDFTYAEPNDPRADAADLIIVAVKGHNLEEALEDMRCYVDKNTVILSLLNGITSEQRISSAYPDNKVLYGLCMSIAANRIGNEIQFESAGRIYFGEADNHIPSSQVQAVSSLFESAGIEHIVPENMMYMLWFKFMINVGVNQVTAVLHAPYSVFQKSPEARELMEAAMWEVIRIAEKYETKLDAGDIEKWYGILSGLHPHSKTSMFDDIEGKRKTEVEEFAGTVCDLGRQCGVETPMNHFLKLAILAIEKSYLA